MASMAALEAGLLALATADVSDGVLVNVVRAGVARILAHKHLGRLDMFPGEEETPLGRVVEPVGFAEVVLFLFSPLNTCVAGAILPVAGGE